MLSNNSTESFELVLEKFHNDHWTIKLPMLSCSLTLIITCFGILVWILYHEKSAIENLSSKKNLGNMVSEFLTGYEVCIPDTCGPSSVHFFGT